MQQDRAGEAEAGVALAVPEQEPGHREQQRERRGQGGVELLPGVELARAAAAAAKPGAIVPVEAVELAQRRDQALAAQGEDERERGQPGDARVEVEGLYQRAASDQDAQLGEVENESRS